MPPLVSIIVPSFNQGRFIGATLESILAQDWRPLEVLIIDGASTDETLEVLHRYEGVPEITWVSEPDSGVVEAVNKGFARARGEFGAIQSSDDCYLPGAIRCGIEALQAAPDLAFVYGDIVKIDAQDSELERTHLAPFSLEGLLSIETWIPQPSTFFRLALAQRLGGWRESVPYAADTDLWLRMAFAAPARKLDVLMAQRRVHDEQRDMQGARIIRDVGRMLDECEGLKTAPQRLRRAAAAGRLLVANRYGYGESYWTKHLRLWRALRLYPHLWQRMPATAFIPGWWPLRRALAALRRRLRRHPRSEVGGRSRARE